MSVQKGYGCAFGGGTIINAVAAWKGCAYATEMKTYAEVCLHARAPACAVRGRIYEKEGGNSTLIELCVQSILEEFNYPAEATVLTKSEIPMAGGLKSSSAAANATILATLDALGREMEPEDIVKLGVRAAKEAGVTITGAYDDACASFYGGVAVTNNKTMTLLKQEAFHYDVLIFNPGEAPSSETNVSRSVLMKDLIETAFEMVQAGDYKKAMKLNGLIYSAALGFDPEPAISCMEIGQGFGIVAGLSGTGPSVTALLPPAASVLPSQREELQILRQEIQKNWAALFPNGRIYETRTCNRNALEESRRFSRSMEASGSDLENADLYCLKTEFE